MILGWNLPPENRHDHLISMTDCLDNDPLLLPFPV